MWSIRIYRPISELTPLDRNLIEAPKWAFIKAEGANEGERRSWRLFVSESEERRKKRAARPWENERNRAKTSGAGGYEVGNNKRAARDGPSVGTGPWCIRPVRAPQRDEVWLHSRALCMPITTTVKRQLARCMSLTRERTCARMMNR